MKKPLPVGVVLNRHQSESQWNQFVTTIISNGDQQCALELAGQKCAIHGHNRPTMLEGPNAWLKSPECTSKYSNGCIVVYPCSHAIWLHHIVHARIFCRH